MAELRGTSGTGWAVWGAAEGGTGVVGTASGAGVGTYGQSDNNHGVWGRSSGGVGVTGDTTGPGLPAVWGNHANGITGLGVLGSASSAPGFEPLPTDTTISYGVRGTGEGGMHAAGGRLGLLVEGRRSGMRVHRPGGTPPAGTWSAATFGGDVTVQGNLQVVNGNKPFKIDHPLDPENKYLLHNAVESSERKNVYDGVVELDEDGAAWVELPEWFEALNGDLRYQLTAIGGPAPRLHVAEKVHENRFRIGGGEEGMEVCWQVTGSRKDSWAAANPFEVEQRKSGSERGRYLEPDLYGAPQERRVILGVEEGESQVMREIPQPPALPGPAPFTPPQAPTMPLGFAAPGFAMQGLGREEENRREIEDLRRQIEALRRER